MTYGPIDEYADRQGCLMIIGFFVMIFGGTLLLSYIGSYMQNKTETPQELNLKLKMEFENEIIID